MESLRLVARVKSYLLKEQIQVWRRYYKNRRFALIDLSLSALYLFSNPYRTCRKFLQKRGAANIYAYGETPLTTLEHIASAFEIGPDDRWLELGAGRGRGCFWMAQFIGCRTVGVEWIPSFVKRANWIRTQFCPNKVTFTQIPLREADFSQATAVYLYSTCMPADEIEDLVTQMAMLPAGSKVITISEPLDFPSYSLVKSTAVSFPWGDTDAYLHIKVL